MVRFDLHRFEAYFQRRSGSAEWGLADAVRRDRRAGMNFDPMALRGGASSTASDGTKMGHWRMMERGDNI